MAGITRTPCRTPREAMGLIAVACGGTLDDGLDARTPQMELDLSDREGRHSVHVRVKPELVSTEEGPRVVIKTRVNWSASTFTPEEAAVGAALHQLAAQKALLAESVARGRAWDPELVFKEDE